MSSYHTFVFKIVFRLNVNFLFSFNRRILITAKWRVKVKGQIKTHGESKSSCHVFVGMLMLYRLSNVIKSSLWPRLVCRRNSLLITSRYGVFRESVCNEEPLSSRARKRIDELSRELVAHPAVLATSSRSV